MSDALKVEWIFRTFHATSSGMIDHSSETRRGVPTMMKGADLLSDLLHGMRLTGLHYRRIEIAPPFGLTFGVSDARAQFHFVARGEAYLRLGGEEEASLLPAGTAVFLPRGGRHEVLSAPGTPSRDIHDFESIDICPSVCAVQACTAEECAGGKTVLFSGCMEFDLGGMHPLVALMPQAMRVDTILDRNPEILPMLEAMEREAQLRRAGYAGILSRLAEVVSAAIVRGWVECGCGDATGWVEALRDPRLGRVIAALHRKPARNWTVAELAAQMGSSRSVFAERFLAVTGVTPLRYLTELRMRLASQWIGRERMPIDIAAARLGYGSPAAFSRAFKRVVGYPPGASRHAATG
jgi:AraC-like DNA-binding protein/mannose-6-phosphate isomerase-like protein (cupin superfamily)